MEPQSPSEIYPPTQEQSASRIHEQGLMLARLFKILPPGSCVLLGGTAVDLLTEGHITRFHPDFDIVAKPEQQHDISATLQTEYTVDQQGNKTIIPLGDGLEAHIVFLQAEQEFGYSVNMANHKIFLPETTFSGTSIPIGDGTVNVMSPEIMMLTLNINRAVGLHMRPKDQKSLKLIHQKYFPDKPVESPEFIPVVQPVSTI